MRKILSLIFVVIFFVGCFASTTKSGLVGVDSKQLMLVSQESMDETSKLSYAKVVAQSKNKGTLNTDPVLTKRVRAISKRLIAQVGAFRDDALKWNWQVNVVNENVLNAWCMPGGRIVVYSGIIKQLNLTDGEIAAVVGHEIAHALREHSREQASTEQLKTIGVIAASAATGVDANAINTLAVYGISLPFSRSHETEADRIGTELMARAGYNPNEAINVWIKMNKVSGGKTPEFLSTHPSNESRIQDLQQISQIVMPLYLASKNK
ncbi:MAG: M48 family metallopeptidase [Campylobacter sp.]|nr:M48 family metallopeptidase [Campylobacter sp.]